MTPQLNSCLLLAVPLAPLIGAAVAGLFGTKFFGNLVGRKVSHTAAIAGVLIAFALSVHTLLAVLDGARFDGAIYTWMKVDGISLEVGFLVDSLTATMMSVVTFVSLMVHIYTIGYMDEDEGYNRFFCYISLFTFAMLMLVMSNNFVQLFFGWEAVGLMSYLLIGFWYDKPSAVVANLKAFLVNRVGDFGFILGIGLLFAYTGSMRYGEVFEQRETLSLMLLPGTTWNLLTVACICLFIGAMAKSAQFPLHVWLPDSMEGPTPISALIHAATMVTAGIFMVSRMSPLFELSNTALSLMLVIGAVTALLMGFVAMTQYDIKRIIAYSTLSQLGYMTVALGASAYPASIFHLMTHAFFKALLFLAAGSVILGMHHDQDIRNMGGLRKHMPFTWITALLGTLALIGTPLFSGFYSKDSIIIAVGHSQLAGSGFAHFAVMASVFVTAFYSFRLLLVVFHGEERFGRHDSMHYGDLEVGLHAGDKPHESPWVMTVPLVLLAIPSVVIGGITIGPMLFGGFFGDAILIDASHQAMQMLSYHFRGALLMALEGLIHLPFVLTLAGAATAWYFYKVNRQISVWMREHFKPLYALLDNNYYLDRFNEIVFAGGARLAGRFLWRVGDRLLIDDLLVNGSAKYARHAGRFLWGSDRIVIDELIVNGSSRLIGWLSGVIRQWQSGHLYHYAFVMILSLLAFLIYFMPFPFGK
ncbi:MAG: NADH:ubiquinone oxidoreductase subunit [Burkholderiaceae bacterium]|nr:NADH:ubiquinone oxidoreductase subunit [Burkholderiaceae bacterium]